MTARILVASYSSSVYTIEFNPLTKTLTRLSSVEVGHHPSWIASHPKDPSLIFAVTEEANGKVFALKYDSQWQGKVIAKTPSGGDDPCSILPTDDELLVANYSSGSISVLPIGAKAPYFIGGSPATTQLTGSGPNSDRQAAPHPHQVYLGPDGEVLVPDLGSDRLYTFTKGSTSWTIASSIAYEPGYGPRHVASHNGVVYTLLELTSKLSAHRDGKLLKTVDTMSNPPKPLGDMLAAEILIPSPNRSFSTPYIYVSNRNDPSPQGDIIAIFAIEADGSPKLVKEVRSGLKHLRGMGFGGAGNKYLVAGGVLDGVVKVFERGAGGTSLVEIASSVDAAPSPTGFLWL